MYLYFGTYREIRGKKESERKRGKNVREKESERYIYYIIYTNTY